MDCSMLRALMFKLFSTFHFNFSNLLLLPLWKPAVSTLSLKLEDLHFNWPFWNMSELSFVCYSPCCNWMFVWMLFAGLQKVPCTHQDQQGLFSFLETRGWLGLLHRSITLSCPFIFGWNEISQWEKWLVRRECVAVTAASQIVQGHQSSAFNSVRQRNGWVGICCCLTPTSCAVKVMVKVGAGWLQDRRKEGRRKGMIGKMH